MIEQDIRYQIDQSLRSKGWTLNPADTHRNVFFEGSVLHRIPRQNRVRLGQKRPDYTLFDRASPLAVIEAKKPEVTDLDDAMEQASEYAEKIGVDLIFACNGPTLKSQHITSNKPLYLNGAEIIEFPSPDILRKFHFSESNEVYTIPKEVIKSRTELIRLFSDLNDDLRADGLRAGIERFSEFANILFLKLLSEKGDGEIWDALIRANEESLLDYINGFAMDQLRKNYAGDVIAASRIQSGSTMKKVVLTLNPLRLTDIDEDIKGVAFEHFIQKTTDTQNDLGEYFTPRHIVRFMVRLLNPKFGQSIYDPFCGTGGFLTESFRHVKQQCDISNENIDRLYNRTVFGSEITTTARIAKMNMILFGDGHSGVKQECSLRSQQERNYNNILSNIPFSQKVSQEVLDIFAGRAQDADEACVLKCFDSVAPGGSMAIVVPEGMLVNRKKQKLLRHLLQNARIRMLVRLPRGCFAPYTDAKTGILYLTDKGVGKTDWFYRVTVQNDGFDGDRNPHTGINDLDKILFFYRDEKDPQDVFPDELDLDVVHVENIQDDNAFSLHADWKTSPGFSYVRLDEVADIKNGVSITEKESTDGDIPVIAGGRGTFRYCHGQSNHSGCVFTISKSGAYSGYVWWHDNPIWASDSLVIRSRDETKYLSRYLYMCMVSKQDEIYGRQQGTGQPHVYESHIKDFPIPALSINDQLELLREFEDTNTERRRIEDDLKRLTNQINESINRYYVGETMQNTDTSLADQEKDHHRATQAEKHDPDDNSNPDHLEDFNELLRRAATPVKPRQT